MTFSKSVICGQYKDVRVSEIKVRAPASYDIVFVLALGNGLGHESADESQVCGNRASYSWQCLFWDVFAQVAFNDLEIEPGKGGRQSHSIELVASRWKINYKDFLELRDRLSDVTNRRCNRHAKAYPEGFIVQSAYAFLGETCW